MCIRDSYNIQTQPRAVSAAAEYIITEDSAEFVEEHRWFRVLEATPAEVAEIEHRESLEYIDFYGPSEEPEGEVFAWH